MHPLIALVTLLTIVLMIVCTILVGRARGKYKIQAPATKAKGLQTLRVAGTALAGTPYTGATPAAMTSPARIASQSTTSDTTSS